MKFKKLLYSLLVVFAFSMVNSKTAEAKIVTGTIKIQYGQTEARGMLDDINKFRTSKTWYWNKSNTKKISVKGRKALKYDYKLEKIAMQRAAELAIEFCHARPNNKKWYNLYDFDSGYTGENLALSYDEHHTMDDVVVAWIEEDKKYDGQGHRRIMLGSEYNYIGIGHAYSNGVHFWVQEFSENPSKVKKTKANDKETTVKIGCESSKITSLKPDKKTITLKKGKTYNLDKIDYYIKTKNTWKYCNTKISFNTNWTSANKKIAYISKNKLKGQKAGTTKITAKVLGKKITVKVKVTN